MLATKLRNVVLGGFLAAGFAMAGAISPLYAQGTTDQGTATTTTTDDDDGGMDMGWIGLLGLAGLLGLRRPRHDHVDATRPRV